MPLNEVSLAGLEVDDVRMATSAYGSGLGDQMGVQQPMVCAGLFNHLHHRRLVVEKTAYNLQSNKDYRESFHS